MQKKSTSESDVHKKKFMYVENLRREYEEERSWGYQTSINTWIWKGAALGRKEW